MVFVLYASQVVAGCEEDNPDRLRFALPPTSIDLSSEHPQWRSAPPTAVPAMVCAGPWALGTDCCSPPPSVPAGGVDCQQYPVACDPSSNLCALTFDVESSANVDLLARVPEIAARDGRVFAHAELTSLSTWIEGASLPIRSADLFIAPSGAGSTSSPEATFVAAVALTESKTPITPTAQAQQAFSHFARDYRAPFSLWVSAHVVVSSGNAQGGTMTVHIEARAQAWY